MSSFRDELNIKVIGGKGGNGCVSFRREKFVAKGGPNGGDGGNGANVIIKVNPHLNTLNHLAHQKVFRAKKGEHGKGKDMHGKSAEDLIIEVPLGTMIFTKEKKELLVDLSEKNSQAIVAKGGIGGLGNARFVTSVRQIPRFAEFGEPGEEKELHLELKLLADVGIIGLPSAGKSTLISAISNAKPKIADYHFTTLVPNLGVVNLSKFKGPNESFVVADIPGLIEGASEGKGLGHQFLKHTSRTKILIHLLDCSSENIAKDYQTINEELKKFDKKLAEKKQIIVLSKIDLVEENELEKIEKKVKKITGENKIFKISSILHQGLKDLVFFLKEKIEEERKKELDKEEEINQENIVTLEPHLSQKEFYIQKISHDEEKNISTFNLTGKRIEQMAIMTDFSNLEGLDRIYHYLEKSKINKSLSKHGAKRGDFIKIGEKQLEFRPKS